MKIKKDFFLRIFFKDKEVKKIKRMDMAHEKEGATLPRVKKYARNFRIKTYLIFVVFSVLAVLATYYLTKHKIILQKEQIPSFSDYIIRLLPVFFAVLIVLELFVIFNRIVEVGGRIFIKPVKKSLILSSFYLFLLFLSIVFVATELKTTIYLKTDIIIFIFMLFYIVKVLVDLVKLGKKYLKLPDINEQKK